MLSVDKQLSEIIIKVCPDIKDYYKSGLHKVYDNNFIEIKDAFDRDIMLDDVLRALEKKQKYNDYCYGIVSLISGVKIGNGYNQEQSPTWLLGQSPSSQSQETKEWLLSKLK